MVTKNQRCTETCIDTQTQIYRGTQTNRHTQTHSCWHKRANTRELSHMETSTETRTKDASDTMRAHTHKEGTGSYNKSKTRAIIVTCGVLTLFR